MYIDNLFRRVINKGQKHTHTHTHTHTQKLIILFTIILKINNSIPYSILIITILYVNIYQLYILIGLRYIPDMVYDVRHDILDI